jgi:hypothetical protein
MTGIVDYKPIAANVGANVISQAQYLTDLAPAGALQNGFQGGTAKSNVVNKVVRQSSMVAAAVASFISQELGIDVLDDGNLTLLITNLTAAIQAVSTPFSTGDAKLTLKNSADVGWVLCNDGTIGDATSGATTRANADCQALFYLLWNNISNSWCPVVGGRGGSAAADWGTHKQITLLQTLGRSLAISGAGAGLSNRALGQNIGEEQHTMLLTELVVHHHSQPDHTHGYSAPWDAHNVWEVAGGIPDYVTGNLQPTHGVDGGPKNTNNTGSGQPFNVMQPTSFWNVMLKL